MQNRSQTPLSSEWSTRVLPPIRLVQLFEISQHYFSCEFGFAFLACSKREGDFCHSFNGKRRFQKEVQGDSETMRIEIGGFVELFLTGSGRERYVFLVNSKETRHWIGDSCQWTSKHPCSGGNDATMHRPLNSDLTRYQERTSLSISTPTPYLVPNTKGFFSVIEFNIFGAASWGCYNQPSIPFTKRIPVNLHPYKS